MNAEEALAATSVAGLEGLLPHGILERRAERTLAVLATGAGSGQRGVTLELRRASEADAVAVAGRREARLVGARRRMAPRVGLEPTTTRLTAGCSTIELPGNAKGGKSSNAGPKVKRCRASGVGRAGGGA